VLAAYSAYRLLAVPAIEPAAGRLQSETPVEFTQAPSRLAGFEEIFPAGAWELDERTKILESDRVKLLWKDLSDLGEGKVELVPYTMIFLGGGSSASEAERARQAYILQAPEGALLTFDRPLDLRKGDVGRLLAGQLRGRITVRSRGKLPGPEDDLLAVTRDVELTEQRLWTPHPVEFTWGRSSGRGAELEVKFLPGERGDGGRRHGMNIGGVEVAKLSRLEHLLLDLRSTASLFGKPKPAAGRAAKEPEQAQVEVTCRGPVAFGPGEQALVLRDQVDVLQVHPNGPSDQVSCEVLAIYFARRRSPPPGNGEPAPKAASAKVSPLADLQPQRIEAQGNPVVVRAPSQQMEARGERLEYDLGADKVVLDASREAFLRRGWDEIHGPHLEYQMGQTGRLGEALVEGPGCLRMAMQGRAAEPFNARWTRRLRMQPQGGQHVISLLGGSEVSFGALGTLGAGEIHFWLQEVPAKGDPPKEIRPSDLGLPEAAAKANALQQGPPPGNAVQEAPPLDAPQRMEIIPDRMRARENVQLSSAKVSAAVGELSVWFKQAAAGWEPVPGGDFPTTSRPQKPSVPAVSPPGQPGQVLPAQHFHVEGGSLQATLLRSAAGSELAMLTVEDNVRIRETQTVEPGAKPVIITGDQVCVFDASKPTMSATVKGNLAHVEGRGMSLSGPNIHINCGTNKLEVQGPGGMELPLDRDFQGRPLSRAGILPADTRGGVSAGQGRAGVSPADSRTGVSPADPVPLVILWQAGMVLDGATARFQESVTASAQGQQLETEIVEVIFTRPFRLGDAKGISQGGSPIFGVGKSGLPEGDSPVSGTMRSMVARKSGQSPEGRPEVKRIVCPGEVLMTGREVDGGQQVSFQRVRAADLDMDVLTGAVRAAGPGHATTVRRRTPGLAAAGLPGGATPGQTADPTKPLTCLDVRCQGPITGNLHHRELVFNDQVRAIYVPTASWETVPQSDDPAELGPEAIVLHCDRLAAVQMLVAIGGQRNWDVQATGNATVEGEGYFARATRMSYDEAKGLLVLAGEPRADAVLSMQKHPGERPTEYRGQQVLYWPKTRQLDSSIRSLEINSLRSLNPGKLFGGSGGKQ